MRNLIIIGLLALVLVAPVGARAQVLTQEEVNSQLLTLINSLMQQVLALMAKLQAVEATQSANTQTLTTIQTQTAPVQTFGAVSQPATPTVSLGTPVCNTLGDGDSAKVPVVISGNWENGRTGIEGKSGRNAWSKSGNQPYVVLDNNNSYNIVVELGNEKSNGTFNSTYTFSLPITVGSYCQ